MPASTQHAPVASSEIDNVEYSVDDCSSKRTFLGSEDAVTQCSLFKNNVIAASEDNNVRVYDLETGKQKLKIPNHKPIHCYVIVPVDENRILLLIGSDDGQVPGWRVKFDSKGSAKGPKCKAKLTVIIPMHQPNPIRAMVMSPRGKYLASGCCFEMTQVSLWGSLETAVRGTLKTWDMQCIVNYVDHPKDYYDDVDHLRLKTYKQIIARTGASDQAQQQLASYARHNDATKEDSSYGVRTIAFTLDDAQILVGFGHPTQAGVEDVKLIALLDAETLDTLWIENDYFHQVNYSVVADSCMC